MTSLRTFQNEIDEIYTRETARQRAQAIAEKEKEKDNKNPHAKGTEVKFESQEEGNDQRGLVDVEEEIQVREIRRVVSLCHYESTFQRLLLSGAAPNHDRARDLIAALITRHRGEYVFRIGSQPPRAKLYSGESFDEEGWTGISRTEQELDTLQKEMIATVDEVGGKVFFSLDNVYASLMQTSGQTSVLFETRTNHARCTLLLRLPPLNVSLTPEVRCAVVGNVDSGKSTTLGVLTRGMSFLSQ